jgi:Ring finger domain
MNNFNRHSGGYENIVERELQRLIEEILFQNSNQNNTRRRPQTRSYSSTTANNNINIPMFSRDGTMDYLDILQYLREVMYVYNTNIQEYQRNFQLSLQVIDRITQALIDENNTYTAPPRYNYYTAQEPEVPRNVRSTPVIRSRMNNPHVINDGSNNNVQTANRDHLFSYVLYRPTIRHQDATALRNFFQNITVRPSTQQINNATEVIHYNTDIENINTSCPITLEDFQEGDVIRRICHCGHAFNEQAIQSWFRSNVRCPVCRYDIREYVLPTAEHGETTEPSYEEGVSPETSNIEHPPTPTSVSFASGLRPSANFGLPNDIPSVGISQNVDEIEDETTSILSRGFEDLIQELSENFAVDLHSIINSNLPENSQTLLTDGSQNFVFEFQVEGRYNSN